MRTPNKFRLQLTTTTLYTRLNILMHCSITVQAGLSTTAFIVLHIQIRPPTWMKCPRFLCLLRFSLQPCRIFGRPRFFYMLCQKRREFCLGEGGTFVSALTVAVEDSKQSVTFSESESGWCNVIGVLVFFVRPWVFRLCSYESINE